MLRCGSSFSICFETCDSAQQIGGNAERIPSDSAAAEIWKQSKKFVMCVCLF